MDGEIIRLEKQIAKYPFGKLICAKNGKYMKWYVSDGKTKKYIPKKEIEFAENLALKKYLQLKKADYEDEKKIVELKLRVNTNRHNEIISQPGYKELLQKHFVPLSKELEEWMNAPYEHNRYYLEQLTYGTGDGLKVRSKSEAMIVTILRKYRIPFRYECVLELRGGHIYPDFTIRHPKTGEVYYWEHLGKMGSPQYYKKVYQRLEQYNDSGIVLGINLIISSETEEHPLDIETIEKIIKFYFL